MLPTSPEGRLGANMVMGSGRKKIHIDSQVPSHPLPSTTSAWNHQNRSKPFNIMIHLEKKTALKPILQVLFNQILQIVQLCLGRLPSKRTY